MADISSNIWKVYAFRFLTGLHFIGAVLIPFFTEWGDLDYSQIFFLQAVFFFSIFVSEVPTGVVADRFGRKYSMFLGNFFIIAGILVYVIFQDFYIFIICEIFWGIGQALYSGADEALLYDTLKQTKREKDSKPIIGKAKNAFLLGLMLAAPMGSLIYVYFQDVRAPVFFMIFPFIFAAIITLMLVEPKRFEKISESKRYIDALREGTKYFATHKILKIFAFDLVLVGSLAWFIIWLEQGIFMNFGIDIKYFGWLHALMVLSQIIVISQFKKMEIALKAKQNLIFFSALIAGAMYLLLGFVSFIPIVIFAIALIAGFGMGRETLYINYMHKYISSDKRATVLSSVSMMHTFVLIIITPLVGMMVDWSMKYTLIILGILILFVALISRFRIKEEMLID